MAFQSKPPLTPPGSGSAAVNEKSSVARLSAWMLALLVLSVLAVVFVLPRFIPQSQAPVRGMPTDTGGDAVAEAAQVQAARRQAEQALQQALRLQAELKLLNAPAWGAIEWGRVSTSLAAGDRLFGERRFAEAGQRYLDAVEHLKDLQQGRAGRLQQALVAGQQALAADKAELAASHYEQALLIEADQPQAVSGLETARRRPQVLAHMRAASRAEADGDIEAAISAVRAALTLDDSYQPAAPELQRLEQKQAAATFKLAMNAALSELQSGKLQAAERHLQQAEDIDPQHPSLLDARRQLTSARQRAALERIRRGTRRLAKSEDWNAAVRAYRQALKIDTNAGFARQGLALAEQRVRLNQQFDHYLNDPSRLYSSEPLANAERLLETISDVPDSQPKLQAKRARLDALVAEAREPLTVRLRSDGQTEVLIYHVGHLGRFSDHALQLKPGTYTAVGSRPGYRDVRRVFTLKPGQPPQVIIEIRCEEPV